MYVYVCIYIYIYIIVLLCFGVIRCYFLVWPWELNSQVMGVDRSRTLAAHPGDSAVSPCATSRRNVRERLGARKLSNWKYWKYIGNIGNIQSIWIPEFQNSPHLQLLILLGESKLSIPICKQAGHRCLTIASSAFLCCLRTSAREEAMPPKLGHAVWNK